MADDSQLEQIEGEIRDHFRALANGFQKLDKIKDPNRQSKQLEELTGKMRECKRLIKEYDREIKDAESGNPPDVNKELNEKKQSMIKELNSYVALRKTYTSSLGNKRVELFDMGAGSSDPAAEDNLQMASKMSNQELIHAGTKAMDETDQAIENSKKVVEQTIEPTSVVTNLPLLDFDVPCQHMSHSLLVGEDKLSTAFWKENPKTTKAVAGSPQSTLCEVGSWSGCSNRSSRASLNGPSQVSSPPTTTMDQKDDAWDLLYAAAGQVMRMKMNEQGLESHGQGLLGQPRKPVPVPVSTHMKTPNSSYYSDDAFAHFQLQHNQFQILRRQQFMRQQLQNRSRASGFGHGRCGRSSSSFCANPPHHHHQQQQGGSGMRVIFLEGSGLKRESVGTGVFLPRRVAVLLNFAGRQLVRPSLFLRELSKL